MVMLVEWLEPGVHELTDEEYFGPALASTTLSSSGAKELLRPGGPARYRHKADAGTVEVKREFDLGHAVHTLVLGAGPEVVLFPGTGANPEAWQKADDKAAVAALREQGKVPLRPTDYSTAHAMAASVRAHPIASKLLAVGLPERTLIWRDPATGVTCRAKVDWLRPDGIVDLKTTDKADDESMAKNVWNFGYYLQAAFYLRGRRWADPASALQVEPWFALVAVEKEPPHLVNVVQLLPSYLEYGDRRCAEALDLYAHCVAEGDWPGYPTDEIPEIGAPAWARTEEY